LLIATAVLLLGTPVYPGQGHDVFVTAVLPIGAPLLQVYLFVTAATFAVRYIRTWLGDLTKGGFGGEVWWQQLRLFHVICYGGAGVFVRLGSITYGASLLFTDVIVGAIIGIWYRYLV